MENLGDILKRLATTRSISGGDPPIATAEQLGQRPDPCAICGGRGWFTPNVPAGHPEFGRIVTCQCQRERLEEERSARLLRYSNLGHLSRLNFETLDPQGRASDPESRRLFGHAYRAAVEYAEDPKGWLVLAGPNGSGKTHVAAAIANRCIAQGHVVFFVHVPDLLDHLRASFAPTSEVSYSDLFEQVRNTPLLILDGLGVGSTTPWAEEKLQQIINHRYNAQLPTVFTTAREINELDPYVRSRLQSEGLSRILYVKRQEPGPAHRLGSIEPKMLARMTFETFDARGNNPTATQRASLETAFQAAKNFAADPDGWLTLFGDTGVGKTHLAIAIAAERTKAGQRVFFAFVPDLLHYLLEYLRDDFTPGSRATYYSLFDEVRNTPLLILDDLRLESASEWAYEKLYQVMVHRHNARLPTIITSPEDFTSAAGPIGSRVRDPSLGQLVRIAAPDYRIGKKGVQSTRGKDPRRAARR